MTKDTMKKIIRLLGLICLLAISCVKEQQDVLPMIMDDQVFYASIDDEAEPDTKAYANEQLYGRWDAGDHISIFNKNTINRNYAFQGQTGDNSGEFRKVVGESFYAGNPLDYVYAVYPYSESTSISDEGVITLTLPAEQSYRENTYGLGANTMIAITEDDELMFKNLCGFFAVKLYGDNVTVTSISLRGNNHETLAGETRVTASMETPPTLTLDSEPNRREITLTCASPVTLGTTAASATVFWFVIPPTVFTRGITITVTGNQGLVFQKTTSGALTIQRNTLKHTAALRVVPPPEPEAIDMGVSVKWASFNLGASTPEEYGDYYAWGETEVYYEPGYSQSATPLWKEGKTTGYSWGSYKWCNGDYWLLTKYCPSNYSNYWDGEGTPDGKTTLGGYDYEDDAARQILGESWHTPTMEEWTELTSNCTCTWTSKNGINGLLVRATNGNSIFLPAAGGWFEATIIGAGSYGDYWSSSLGTSRPHFAQSAHFTSNEVNSNYGFRRYNGLSVRPVYITTLISSIQLSETTLSLRKGDHQRLEATILPDNASRKELSWTSSNESVASVDSNGIIYAHTPGSAIIYANAIDGSGVFASCTVSVLSPPLPEAVDLGLSVKWASFNLGATAPEEYGDYYSWGETTPYYSSLDPLTWKTGKENGYLWPSYQWCNGNSSTLTKYNTISGFGTVDDKSTLDLADDAARANWGGTWRMPTQSEIQELINYCTAVWTTENEVYGMRFTSRKNGYTNKSIFIPAAGEFFGSSLQNEGSRGYIWSSSLNSTNFPNLSHFLYIYSDGRMRDHSSRCNGFSIRPVCPKN